RISSAARSGCAIAMSAAVNRRTLALRMGLLLHRHGDLAGNEDTHARRILQRERRVESLHIEPRAVLLALGMDGATARHQRGLAVLLDSHHARHALAVHGCAQVY